MPNWTGDLMQFVIVLVGVVAVLLLASRSWESPVGDNASQITRIERKLDLILSSLGIVYEDHVPETVVSLARAGRKIEAIKEYRRLTGADLAVAKREVESVIDRLSFEKKAPQDEH